MSTTQINDGTSTVATSISSPPSSSAVGLVVREAAQGQKTMANSIPVVIGSDQSTIPVRLSSNSAVVNAGAAPFTYDFKLFDFRFLGQDNKLLWYEAVTGAGASTFSTATNELSMNTTNGTSGNEVVRQTQRIMGQSGAPNIFIVNCTLGAKKTNVRQQAGAFDANDGLFFEQDISNLKVVYRTSISGAPVDTAINQSAWNVDKLDGTGNSTITLDTSKNNIYFTINTFNYLQFGVIISGSAYFCHQIATNNTTVDAAFATRNFPIRIVITNTGAATGNTTLLVEACSAYASGGTTPFGIVRAADLGITGKTIGASLTPLISIRLKNSNIRNKLLVQNMNMILSASQTVYVALIFNGALTGSAFATTSGTNTISEFDSAATAISGGDVIFSTYTSGSGQGNGNSPSPNVDISSLLQVSSTIDAENTSLTAGTSTGANTTTTLNDTGETWKINQWTNKSVLITGGTGIGQERTITSNTATQLTINAVWSITPNATSTYQINGSDIITLAAQKSGGTSPTGYPSLIYREFV